MYNESEPNRKKVVAINAGIDNSNMQASLNPTKNISRQTLQKLATGLDVCPVLFYVSKTMFDQGFLDNQNGNGVLYVKDFDQLMEVLNIPQETEEVIDRINEEVLIIFSVEMIRNTFPEISEQIIKNSLYRFSLNNRIISVYKGFYVITPPHYAAKGIVPPTYYIDQLMQYIDKPYYISLLSAAEFFGAAHQRSQRFFVTTVLPSTNVSKTKNRLLNWLFRKEIPEKFLLTKNSETGIIRYSNAELTAIDLVQYENVVGGLSRVATVLDELCEQTDFSNVNDKLFDFTSVSAVQRLGYILENILEQNEQADVLHEKLIA